MQNEPSSSTTAKLRAPLMAVCLAAAWVVPGAARAEEPEVFGRAELIADARQLASTLEQSHPDPYLSGGGKVAFHRRLQDLIRTIPVEGMTQRQFYRHVLPFVAALRDGHTAVLAPQGGGDPAPGLPVAFRIVEGSLIVASSHDATGQPASGKGSRGGGDLRGAELLSIEAVPTRELIRRQAELRGMENVYGTMALLSRGMQTTRGLQVLIPEWKDTTRMRASFRLPSGVTRELTFAPGPVPAVSAASRIELPDMTRSDVAWRFLDGAGRTALLKVTGMEAYREGCEGWLAMGMSEAPDFIRAAYQKFHGQAAPEDLQAALAGIPAATDVFIELVAAMKAKGTENLIVDLRDNTGGNGLMVSMLLYFLFDAETVSKVEVGYQIVKYSDLFFQMYTSAHLDELNRGRDLPLEAHDYDFAGERAHGSARGDAEVWSELKKAPSFYRRFEQGLTTYRPKRIVALSSTLTYSSGFSMLAALESLGATVVGTPSAHAGNNYGDSLLFELNNTKLRGAVSFKQNIVYPDDPEKGRCLMPDVILTRAKLAALHFDPNADVLLALEALNAPKTAGR